MEEKFLSDNEETTIFEDKSLVLFKDKGEDYKASFLNLKRELLKGFIGNLYFNLNPQLKDKPVIQKDSFEYLLLAGQSVQTKDYPELAKFFNQEEEESFVLPNMQDGTLRNIKVGDTRTLGSWQKDAFKVHDHGLADISFSFSSRALDDFDTMDTRIIFPINNISSQDLAYKNTSLAGGKVNNGTPREYTFSSHNAGVKITDATGDIETRMKNMGVQTYILAKII